MTDLPIKDRSSEELATLIAESYESKPGATPEDDEIRLPLNSECREALTVLRARIGGPLNDEIASAHHEAWLRFLNKPDKWLKARKERPNKKFDSWFYGCVRNQLRSERRSSYRAGLVGAPNSIEKELSELVGDRIPRKNTRWRIRSAQPLPDSGSSYWDDPIDSESIVQEHRLRAYIWNYIDRECDSALKLALHIVYREGRTISDAADALAAMGTRVPRTTLTGRIQKFIQQMRDHFGVPCEEVAEDGSDRFFRLDQAQTPQPSRISQKNKRKTSSRQLRQ